jgi:hypothetical protein
MEANSVTAAYLFLHIYATNDSIYTPPMINTNNFSSTVHTSPTCSVLSDSPSTDILWAVNIIIAYDKGVIKRLFS